MSTPTSREPDERDPAVTKTPSDTQTPSDNPESSAPGTVPGQHAAARPYPPSGPPTALPAPPSPGPAPGTIDAPQGTMAPLTGSPADRRLVGDRTVVDDPTIGNQTPSLGHRTAPETAPPTPAPEMETRHSRRELAELPDAPAKPGFFRHVLGILLGLLLTPVALLLTGIGMARLTDSASSGDTVTDALGVSLLVAGALLLAVIALLAVWSPAVPITGGLVWGVALGAAYLIAPGIMQDSVDAAAGDRVVPAAIEQLTESATSGQLLVVGALLVAAGLATARARRRGRRWAEGVAAAEAARTDPRVTSGTSA